ncbi:hypothetical protein NC652_017220 [Populus alba x Populus x berolinensis]|nr:hypothetical protein NC652_017220 [Populus alba x Populus x berolinensis]
MAAGSVQICYTRASVWWPLLEEASELTEMKRLMWR